VRTYPEGVRCEICMLIRCQGVKIISQNHGEHVVTPHKGLDGLGHGICISR